MSGALAAYLAAPAGATKSRLRACVCGVAIAAVLALPASPAVAQQRPATAGTQPRAALERQLQQRLDQIARRELQLSDPQVVRLRDARRRYEGERLPLLQRERELRRLLRQELQAGDGANGRAVDGYLAEILKLQRRRLEITEAEQKDLAGFLTPVQRARYLGLQESLRERVDAAAARPRPGPLRNRPGAAPPPR